MVGLMHVLSAILGLSILQASWLYSTLCTCNYRRRHVCWDVKGIFRIWHGARAEEVPVRSASISLELLSTSQGQAGEDWIWICWWCCPLSLYSDQVICLVYMDDTLFYSPKPKYIDDRVNIERNEPDGTITLTQTKMINQRIETLNLCKLMPATAKPSVVDVEGNPPSLGACGFEYSTRTSDGKLIWQ